MYYDSFLITKRDGTQVPFKAEKIKGAIRKAFHSQGYQYVENEVDDVFSHLTFCHGMSVEDIQNFIYIFFPFMFGIYPYTAVTEKQKTAMTEAGINYVYQTVYELTYSCLIRLLGK